MVPFMHTARTLRHAALFASAAATLCCSAAPATAPPPAAPANELPARVADAPAGRPAPADSEATLLRFLALGRGDRMADLGSGDGYSILPFTRAVGPFGLVYARHAPKVSQHLPSNAVYETPAESLPENVVPMATALNAPLLPQVKNLDAVTFLFGYHRLIAEQPDRVRFHLAVLRALKPGGVFVVAERGADADVVRAEVQSAGFRFVEAADSLSPGPEERPAGDPAPPQADEYVLKFQKPR
jgi:predicted methyltransferase